MKKSSKSLSKADLVFVLVVGLGFVSAAALYYEGERPRGPNVGSEPIGTITYRNNLAERKINGKVLWDGLVQNSPVYENDTIRTASDSQATIYLDNQTEIDLDEESMVLVSMPRDRASRIKVLGGGISVSRQTAGGAAEATIVETRAGEVQVDEGTVGIADSGQDLRVVVDSGQATVRASDGRQQTIDSTVSLELTTMTRQAQPLRLQSPGSGDLIALPEDQREVSFSWAVPEAGAVSSAVLTIASDSAFRQILTEKSVTGTQTSVALPDGTWYWKVGDSPSRWINVKTLRPPKALQPVGKTFRFTEQPPLVGFAWSPVTHAASYRLEVYRQDGDAAPVWSRTVTTTTLAADVLSAGSYRWRAVALTPGGVEIPGNEETFQVLQGALSAPALTAAGMPSAAAAPETTVSTVSVKNGAVLTSWQHVEGADGYEASLSRDPEGKRVVASVVTKTNQLRVEAPLAEGTYYVRVVALSGGVRSEGSAALRVLVKTPVAPVLNEPASGARLDPTVRDLRFRWTDTNGTSRYRLTLTGPAGEDLASVLVTTPRATVTVPEAVSGALSWKVEVLDAQEATLMTSQVSQFVLPRILPAVNLLAPQGGERIDVNETSTLRFRWEAVPEVDSYRLVLYRVTGGLRDAVHSWTGSTDFYELTSFEALAADSFAWEVQAFQGPESGRTGVSRKAQAYFRLFQSSPLPAPVIKKKS